MAGRRIGFRPANLDAVPTISNTPTQDLHLVWREAFERLPRPICMVELVDRAALGAGPKVTLKLRTMDTMQILPTNI